MAAWLDFARGPLFIFAFNFMVFGMIRNVALTLLEMRRTVQRAGDKSLPVRQLTIATVKWLLPFGKIRTQFFMSITSIIFHVAILIVPIFLGGHIALWSRSIGISWPAISNSLADVLTILGIIAAVLLVIQRLAARATRALSRLQDHALPIVIAVPLVTGFMVMHPGFNPFSFEAVMLMHVLSGNLLLILMPITKLTHAGLMPGVQLVSELGWHWPADSGRRVAVALRKEEEPI